MHQWPRIELDSRLSLASADIRYRSVAIAVIEALAGVAVLSLEIRPLNKLLNPFPAGGNSIVVRGIIYVVAGVLQVDIPLPNGQFWLYITAGALALLGALYVVIGSFCDTQTRSDMRPVPNPHHNSDLEADATMARSDFGAGVISEKLGAPLSRPGTGTFSMQASSDPWSHARSMSATSTTMAELVGVLPLSPNPSVFYHALERDVLPQDAVASSSKTENVPPRTKPPGPRPKGSPVASLRALAHTAPDGSSPTLPWSSPTLYARVDDLADIPALGLTTPTTQSRAVQTRRKRSSRARPDTSESRMTYVPGVGEVELSSESSASESESEWSEASPTGVVPADKANTTLRKEGAQRRLSRRATKREEKKQRAVHRALSLRATFGPNDAGSATGEASHSAAEPTNYGGQEALATSERHRAAEEIGLLATIHQ